MLTISQTTTDQEETEDRLPLVMDTKVVVAGEDQERLLLEIMVDRGRDVRIPSGIHIRILTQPSSISWWKSNTQKRQR